MKRFFVISLFLLLTSCTIEVTESKKQPISPIDLPSGAKLISCEADNTRFPEDRGLWITWSYRNMIFLTHSYSYHNHNGTESTVRIK